MAQPKTAQHHGHTIHFSVGALIMRSEQILLMDRAQPPFGLAGPAGHIDENEGPLAAIKRELTEETGWSLQSCKLIAEEFIDWNTCSQGITGHYWYVYRCEVQGELKADPREVKSIGWYDVKDLKGLEPVWDFWLKRLDII